MTLLLLLAVIPTPYETTTHVDVIELNHLMDPATDKPVLDQLVFWELENSHYRVVDWLMVRNIILPPARTPTGWILRFHKSGKHHRVVAFVYMETFTTVDIELLDREIFPQSQRRGLATQ